MYIYKGFSIPPAEFIINKTEEVCCIMNECLININEIYETKNCNEVNRFLKDGWVLLSICVESHYPEGNFPKHENFKYVLGWDSRKVKFTEPLPSLSSDYLNISCESMLDINCDF